MSDKLLFLDFGLSQLSHVAGFYVLANARLKFSTNFVLSIDPNEWCLKNGLHSGGLSTGLLGHESSTLPLDHNSSPFLTNVY